MQMTSSSGWNLGDSVQIVEDEVQGQTGATSFGSWKETAVDFVCLLRGSDMI